MAPATPGPDAPVACRVCGGPALSRTVGVCRACLMADPAASGRIHAVRRASRARFGLPEAPPRTADGIRCAECANLCSIPEGARGFCGLRTVRDGRLIHLAGTPSRGLLRWYRDPLPTNCVADWVCHGSRQPGRSNLAVFYASCTMDCIFCQNWHFRSMSPEGATVSARELADAVTPQTFCACFFGGDPASQMGHALAAGKTLAGRGIRVCWETNGTMHPRLLDAAMNLSLHSGGCVKFDLKAWDDRLHHALTGVPNRRPLENFARIGARFSQRLDPPLLVASTLLVPGYVMPEEVGAIARFIASIDPRIPYTLLAFAPMYLLSDLPATSFTHAREAEEAALAAGLERVRIGNRHLLTDGV
ncbi:radical SAM protein [Candidatus Fermentibacteria bacterium]|nr:radical SAM protein [Candidatus Fermentibacteria bacterium]